MIEIVSVVDARGTDMRENTCDNCFIADTDACPMGGRADNTCDAFFEKGVEP